VALTVALPDAPAPQSGVRRILRTLAADAVDPTLIFWHRLLPRAELAREQLRNVVLAGLDDRAVPVAGELAAAYGAALVIVAARNPIRGSAEELEARVERQAAPLRGRIGEVGIVVRAGDLGAILLDEAVARRARLIVVSGADADQGVAGRLLGRVWDHVSHHASCDVLVVR
jgi:nucleotide-binding universal stress UspA family protein